MSGKFDLHHYDDIIDLPHHVSPNRRRMSNTERGAQFSPFAALTGYEAAVEEAARLTDGKKELTEEMKAIIDAKIQAISEHPDAEPQVTITYFKPDERKEGGAYVRVTGAVKEIDRIGKTIVLTDHTEIPMEQIREIEAEWMHWVDGW